MCERGVKMHIMKFFAYTFLNLNSMSKLRQTYNDKIYIKYYGSCRILSLKHKLVAYKRCVLSDRCKPGLEPRGGGGGASCPLRDSGGGSARAVRGRAALQGAAPVGSRGAALRVPAASRQSRAPRTYLVLCDTLLVGWL